MHEVTRLSITALAAVTIMEMTALGETLYCQLAYALSLAYARNPVNKAIQTVPSTAAPISHTQDPDQLNGSRSTITRLR